MSVVAWDGKTLAADRQAGGSGAKRAVSKIRKLADGTIVAWTGQQDTGQIMADWYEAGADLNKYPPSQTKDDWSRLTVVKPNGEVFTYEQYPAKLIFPEHQMYDAWGAGRDFALGALAVGATAREAVEIANRFCESCGFGVEAYDVMERLQAVGD